MPSGDASAYGPRTITTCRPGSFRGVAVTATNSDDLAGVRHQRRHRRHRRREPRRRDRTSTTSTRTATSARSPRSTAAPRARTTSTGAHADQSVRVAAANQFYHLGIAGHARDRRHRRRRGAGRRPGRQPEHQRLHRHGASVNAHGTTSRSPRTARTRSSRSSRASAAARSASPAASPSPSSTPTPTRAPASGRRRLPVPGHGATINAGNDVLVSAKRRHEGSSSSPPPSPAATSASAPRSASPSVDKDTQGVHRRRAASSTRSGNGHRPRRHLRRHRRRRRLRHATRRLPRRSPCRRTRARTSSVSLRAVGGGFVGVAGGVGVTIIHVVDRGVHRRRARNVNATLGANASQSVNVSAVDKFKSLTDRAAARGVGFVGVARRRRHRRRRLVGLGLHRRRTRCAPRATSRSTRSRRSRSQTYALSDRRRLRRRRGLASRSGRSARSP